MIRKILTFVLFILLTFGSVSFSAITEDTQCKAPKYFEDNYSEDYFCSYNTFITDIEEGFEGLPFPQTRAHAQLFFDVIHRVFLDYYYEIPIFFGYDVALYNTTEKGDKRKSALIILLIDTYSEKKDSSLTLRLKWELLEKVPEEPPKDMTVEEAPQQDILQKSKSGKSY